MPKNGFISLNGLLSLAILAFSTSFVLSSCFGQDDAAKSGYLIDAPVPLDSETSGRVLAQLENLAESVPEGKRLTVVIRYQTEGEAGSSTPFEDALKLARAMTQPKLRRIKVVSLLTGKVVGHSTLPILASDSLIVAGNASMGNATAGEASADETILLTYKSIAARRGLFPPAIVEAMVDPNTELAKVSKTGGGEVYAANEELKKLRDDGVVLGEDVLSIRGEPLVLDGKQLREARIAIGIVDSIEQAADMLDLAKLNSVDSSVGLDDAKGVMIKIAGSISANRARRWQSNLSSTIETGDINTWVIAIDSNGGDFNESATLAGWFAEPDPPLRTVAGLIQGEARGDAALFALACDPLFMKPDAKIGGPGNDNISDADLQANSELIELIARQTKRPKALIQGLLQRDLVIHRYKHKTNGRITYMAEGDFGADAADPELERERWERLEKIELAGGLTAKQALELGLIDGESQSLDDTSRRVGLSGTPPTIEDRGIVRFVERLGRSQGLAFLLLFIGFVTLSAEANAPGISVPGFISMVCFGLYFWMNFLNGTAEWLELILFGLGLMCIALEIFVVPGFGIFGIGGIALTIFGVVLMSQTFVVPRNTYQIGVLTRGLWIALGSFLGIFAGFIAVRTFLPHIPLFNGLVMDGPDAATVSEAEKLADFSFLAGKTGTSTTKLMPSGKARFGDRIVAVVSDGSAIPKGAEIRVIEIQGNRIVVEAMNS